MAGGHGQASWGSGGVAGRPVRSLVPVCAGDNYPRHADRFYGTIPAAFVIFHLDSIPAAAHYSATQDTIVLAAFGVLIGGVSLTLYFTVRFTKRPSAAASVFGVTVFNWKTVTLPWDNITDVVLTPATRFTKRGWVPGIVQRDGQVLPVAFAEFRPSGGQAQGPVPRCRRATGCSESPH